MQFLRTAVAKGAIWTLGGYGVTQALRFGTSVLVARLLAPELFGIMVIINTVRTGVELLSDIGIVQSIIRASNAEEPDFYNTAWTLQVLRGIALFAICLLAAIPLATVYDNSILSVILPASGLTFLFGGFTSIGIAILRRRMNLIKLNLFEIITAAGFSAFQIFVAYIYPSVWALVLGLVFGSFINFIGSFLLLPSLSHRFVLIEIYIQEIVRFGKWIMVSSAVYFATMSFDRLYLASAVELGTLGLYGIARTIAEIVANLFLRLSSSVIFPYISAMSDRPRKDLYASVAPVRFACLIVVACLLSLFASLGDFIVGTLFDERYQSAGWMLSIFMVGVWFSIISALNEATLLGFGKSQYGAVSNGFKFIWLVISLPLSLKSYGIVGAVVVVALSDLCRWLPLLVGQRQQQFSFAKQDFMATLVLMLGLCCFLGLRWQLGVPLRLGGT